MKRTSGYNGAVVVAIFFPFSFEGGGMERMTCFLPVLFVSFFLAICVHSFVGEVDSGVLRVSGPSAPGLLKAIFFGALEVALFPVLLRHFRRLLEETYSLADLRCDVEFLLHLLRMR
jgi:Ca2+/H+ antiporter